MVAAGLVLRPGRRAGGRHPTRTRSRVNQRDEAAVGNIKQVWEVNRLQHLTLLAAAWYLTARGRVRAAGRRPAPLVVAGEPVPVRGQLDERHRARRPADQLRLDPAAARRAGPGSRTCSRVDNDGAADPLAPGVPGRVREPGLLGEQPPDRRGGRAARGELRLPVVPRERAVAARGRCRCWSARSRTTRSPPGINRELASDYHGFVFELGCFAAVEAAAAGTPVSDGTWRLLCVDGGRDGCTGRLAWASRPARATRTRAAWCCSTLAERGRWPALLSLGDGAVRPAGVVAGRAGRTRAACWLRSLAVTARKSVAARLRVLTVSRMRASRSSERPRLTHRSYGAAAMAGRTGSCASPRTRTPTRCRWRSATAAWTSSPTRARTATTVSRTWRSYFQSTIGHNTLEVDGRWQSVRGGAVPVATARGGPRDFVRVDDGRGRVGR